MDRDAFKRSQNTEWAQWSSRGTGQGQSSARPEPQLIRPLSQQPQQQPVQPPQPINPVQPAPPPQPVQTLIQPLQSQHASPMLVPVPVPVAVQPPLYAPDPNPPSEEPLPPTPPMPSPPQPPEELGEHLIDLNQGEGSHFSIKRAVLGGGMVLFLLILSIGAGALTGEKEQSKKPPANNVLGDSTIMQSTTQDNSGNLQVGLPSGGQSNVNQSGAEQNKLSSKSPYYQYVDNFKGGEVVISRSPLPDNFKSNPNALKNFANNIHADQGFQTSRWGTVYISTDNNAKVQVLVMANNEKQVFIQSKSVHDVKDWKPYLETLNI